nr:hypothetical protein [uncultured Sphingomonas sp.]
MDLLSFAAETGSIADWIDPPPPKRRCMQQHALVDIGRRLHKADLPSK